MADNKKIAQDVLAAVGGAANVTNVTHCMTRLRFNLKDMSIPDDKAVAAINGVLGAQISGGQYQVIIGQNVPKVYAEICGLGGFAQQAPIDENLDKPKQPFSLARLGSSIMDALTGCLTPLIPVLMVVGMLKMAVAVFGPSMLGILDPESDLARLLTFVGDAGFYFFPVLVGYTGAKKFGCSPVLAIMMGGVLLHPSLIEIVNTGEPFTVFGIPMTPTVYSSSVIPMILITWVMSYVEKLFRKFVPDLFSTILVPLMTFLVMTPLALCVLGPIGGIFGNYVTAFLIWFHNVAGPFGVAVIGMLFLLLVATGMHMPLLSTLMMSMASLGYDATILPGITTGVYVCIATDLAFALKAKTAEERNLGLSCLAAQALGGVGEPAIFGILLRYKKALAWNMIGSFCGTLVVGLMQVKCYLMATSNIMVAVGFGPDLGKGLIGCAVGFLITFILTMVFGYEDKKIE